MLDDSSCLVTVQTARSSAIAEGPCDKLYQLKSCHCRTAVHKNHI